MIKVEILIMYQTCQRNEEIMVASGDVGIRVLIELCHGILDGKGIQEDWATSVAIPIFKEKGDIMNCGMHRGVKLLEHAMKIVENVLEKRLRKIVTIDDMQFGFMSSKGTIEEYLAKQKKLYMCFVDLEKTCDRK